MEINLKKNPKGFYKDIAFSVEENPAEITEIRFFGEELLHLELQTGYGKKEIVCGNGVEILNHVILKNMTVNSDSAERLSVFASYEISDDESIKIALRHQNSSVCQLFNTDITSLTFSNTLSEGEPVTKSFKLSPLEKSAE